MAASFRLANRTRTFQSCLCPFLFQTRTLIRPREATSTLPRATRNGSSQAGFKDEERTNRNHASSDPASSGSTITRTEQQAFARIFDEIMSSSAGRTQNRQVQKEGASKTPKRTSDIDDIFLSAIDNVSSSGEQPNRKPAENVRSLTDTISLRYPPSLRQAAARAADFWQQNTPRNSLEQTKEDHEIEGEQEADSEAEVIRKSELARVEKLLRDAAGGVEILKILESELFPLLAPLDDEADSMNTKRSKKGKKTKKAKETESLPSLIPEHIPPLAILGINYPHLLLLATRLLNETHKSPALAVALFARVKSLSLVSYVLGASTALYNEILQIRWVNYRDFRAIDELLSEMDQQGVEFDERTESFLREMNAERDAVMAGRKGEFTKALWDLEGGKRASSKLNMWAHIVSQRLEETRRLNAELGPDVNTEY